MRKTSILSLAVAAVLPLAAWAQEKDAEGFIQLFNGKDLSGWKVSENPESFQVEDGKLIAKGERAHLFYTGDVGGGDFKDFEAKLEVMTKPGANAGFYFHTEYQEEGWPNKGFEAQINATHKDPKKTGSIYAVKDVMNIAPHKDGVWFDYHIIVKGNTITLKVNGEVTATYTQKEGETPNEKMPGRKLDHGTIAIQAHDPGSEVHIRSIKVKPL